MTRLSDPPESAAVLAPPSPPASSRPMPPLTAAWLTESVRRIEARGPLEDSDVLRDVARDGGSRERQVVARAERLAGRLGLAERIDRVRWSASWGLLAVVAVVVIVGLALAGGVIDARDRRINVMAALVGLLGSHVVTLALWLLSVAWPRLAAFGGSAFGRMWWALTSRASLGRGAEATALTSALMGMLQRARITPWLFGLVSHLVWALAFGVALASLLFALSFRHYTLGWETTLLDPAVFARWIQALAIVPGWFGFAVPDEAAPTNQQLAGWLIGCLFVYGLVPRTLLAILCAIVVRRRRKRLVPEWPAPYYRQLFARLDALAPAVVVDADTHGDDPRPGRAAPAGATGDEILVAGFELPDELPWPPPGMPDGASPMRIDGSAAQRATLLDRLAGSRPRVLVLACRAESSPDRGTERLLREAVPRVGQCRLWLLGEDPVDGSGVVRWRSWLRGIGFEDLRCSTDAGEVFDESASRPDATSSSGIGPGDAPPRGTRLPGG
ncbi:MAG: DUF2868 domain-containing protein [Burkholderiaceae bacterium]